MPTRADHGSSADHRLASAVLLIGLVGLIALGARWAGDFGMSWDVTRTARLGRLTLESYRTGQPTSSQNPLGDMDRHGPAVAALTEWATGKLVGLWPERPEYQVRYFVSFLWFPLGVACFYLLARRWVAPAPALVTSALLASQPLLFGHGFINPSDGPFLTLFAAVMLMGHRFGDLVARRAGSGSTQDAAPSWRDLREDWNRCRLVDRRRFLFWSTVFVAFALELLFFHRIILPILLGWVRAAYSGEAWPPINELFRLVAEDAARAPFEAYFSRLWFYYSRLRWLALALLVVPVVVYLGRAAPKVMAGLRQPGLWAWVGLSGAILGIASAVRLIAPLAGLLVTVVVLARTKYRCLGLIIVYWGIATVVSYLAWPSLWPDPWTRSWAFLKETATVPFDILVLFAGRVLLAEDLPWHYLPTFLILQTTLPALVLGGAGMVLSLGRAMRHRMEGLVTALWLVLPVALAIGLGSTLYDNGRHYNFVRPAWFLFAALGLEWVWGWRKSPAIRVALTTVVLLPGVLGIARLHPYEYVYFNELVGGVQGAFRRYELDYWATSYRETMAYINREGPAEAVVAVGTARELFDDYARSDLRLAPERLAQIEDEDIDFAMISTRADQDLVFFPDAPVVFSVGVGKATLAVVRDLR